MIERRRFVGLAFAGLGMCWSASEARACSIAAVNRTPFSDRRCRQAIAEFVTLLNEAPSLSWDDASRRLDEMGVEIEEDWARELTWDRSMTNVDRQYAFVQEYRKSGGILDPKPVEIDELNLIRRLGNRATYQFSLKRYSYHPADPEGCNGLFVHDEYYGYDRLACLATFSANRLNGVRRFPEWYLDG